MSTGIIKTKKCLQNATVIRKLVKLIQVCAIAFTFDNLLFSTIEMSIEWLSRCLFKPPDCL